VTPTQQLAALRGEIAKDRPRKYHNTPVTVDGVYFASQKEAARWGQLKLLERAGLITNLRRQVRYPLDVNGARVAVYIADHDYIEDGELITEDSKGFVTKEFRLKAKLFEAIYGRKIRVT
jgi:hypothetical protein